MLFLSEKSVNVEQRQENNMMADLTVQICCMQNGHSEPATRPRCANQTVNFLSTIVAKKKKSKEQCPEEKLKLRLPNFQI